jgi:hypothetical protein
VSGLRKVEYIGKVPVIPLSLLLNPEAKSEDDLTEYEMELFAWGRVNHRLLQKQFGKPWISEIRCTWPQTDSLRRALNLPFFISYHPDLFNPEEQTVAEIKSSSVEAEGEGRDQAILQLSSYAHFLGAKKARVIYYEVVKTREEEIEVVPLEKLRTVWIEGWKKLVKLGRVILR